MHRVIQVAVRVAAGLALACALLVLAARACLMTDAGRRAALDRLSTAGLVIDARALDGDPFSAPRLRGVTARLCAADLVLRADEIAVRYRLLPLLAGERRVALTVEGAALERGAGCDAPAGRPPPPVIVDPLVVRGRGLAAHGRVDLAPPRALDLAIDVTRDDVPALRGDVKLEARLHGPIDDLRLAGVARVAGREIEVTGRADAIARAAELELDLRDLPVDPPSTSVTLMVSGRARVRLAGEHVEVSARGAYRRREGAGRLAEPLPGGRFAMTGEGSVGEGGLRLDFDVELDETGVAARLLGEPERSAGSRVRGSLRVAPGERPRLAAEVVAR